MPPLLLNRRLPTAGTVLWGLLLALWLARGLFLLPVDRIYRNHEGLGYVGRLLEFRDQLEAGNLAPQWSTSFRGGLGSAHFCYYQPGFFYLASLVPWGAPPVRALGVAVALMALMGYLATYALLAPRFGRLGGLLGASSLLLSPYAATEIYLRGDLTEFCGMMLVPAALWALAGWFDHGRLRHAIGLSLASAGMIVSHPAVGLMGYLLLAVAWLTFWLATRDPRRTIVAALALALGIGLAAFYWLPVLGEWKLVNTDTLFSDYYHYSNHFIHPLALLLPVCQPPTVPVMLGIAIVLSAALNLTACYRRSAELTAPQRRLVMFCLVAIVGFSFLMTRGSAWIWGFLGPLQRIQFPWRMLAVVTPLAAVLAGTSLPWRSEGMRAIATLLLILVMCGLSCSSAAHDADPQLRVPQTVDELVAIHFAPDLRGEWLPRGAQAEIPEVDRKVPQASPGCEVQGFQRTAGRLQCRVRTNGDSFVVLPHYYFPVGWAATLDAQPVPFAADPRGLMRVELPGMADGLLEVRFTHTPLHRLGLALSAGSLALGLAVLALILLRRVARRPINRVG